MKSTNEAHASYDERDVSTPRLPAEKNGWEGVVFQLEDLTGEEWRVGKKPGPDHQLVVHDGLATPSDLINSQGLRRE